MRILNSNWIQKKEKIHASFDLSPQNHPNSMCIWRISTKYPISRYKKQVACLYPTPISDKKGGILPWISHAFSKHMNIIPLSQPCRLRAVRWENKECAFTYSSSKDTAQSRMPRTTLSTQVTENENN